MRVPYGLGSTMLKRDDFFFERNVDGIAYLRMFDEFVFPQLAERFNNQHWERRFRSLWWAQDGAPAHPLVMMCLGIITSLD